MDLTERRETKERRANVDLLVLREAMDTEVKMVSVAPRDTKVMKVKKVLMARKVKPDTRDLLDLEETKDLTVKTENPARRVNQVSKEFQANPEIAV